jgi:hypothetical protein
VTFWPIDFVFSLFGEYLSAALRFTFRRLQRLVQWFINLVWSNPGDEVNLSCLPIDPAQFRSGLRGVG